MIGPNPRFERIKSALLGALTSKSALVVLVLLVAISLMNWRVPTRVEVQVTADRISMIIGGEAGQLSRLLDALEFQTLAIRNFSVVRLNPQKVQVADPGQYDLENDRFPSSAWKQLDFQAPQIAFKPADDTPSLTMEPVEPGASVGVQPLWVTGGSSVEMELVVGSNRSLTIRLEGAPVRLFVRVNGPIEIISEQSTITGMDGNPYPGSGSRSYLFDLKEQVIEVVGGREPLVLSLELGREPGLLFSNGTLPIQAIDVTRQGTLGVRESAVLGAGRIGYPDYPGISDAPFESPEFVEFGEFRDFYLKSLAVDTEIPGLLLLAEGTANRIRTGMPASFTDRRLSRFDNLWHSRQLRQLFSVWKTVK